MEFKQCSVQEAEDLSCDIVEILAGGGFSVKGFTMSGKPPLPTLTKDGVSINTHLL